MDDSRLGDVVATGVFLPPLPQEGSNFFHSRACKLPQGSGVTAPGTRTLRWEDPTLRSWRPRHLRSRSPAVASTSRSSALPISQDRHSRATFGAELRCRRHLNLLPLFHKVGTTVAGTHSASGSATVSSCSGP